MVGNWESLFGSNDLGVLGFEVVAEVHHLRLERYEAVHVGVRQDGVWILVGLPRNAEHLLKHVEFLVPLVQVGLNLSR